MNSELRRYGIVIKSTRVDGEKASIGSGVECAIQIEDPYLAAHVGDLVRRGDTWYITDAGTSLDGILRDGERIDDEAVIDGEVYSISGFELVTHTGAAPRVAPAEPARSNMIPGTIVEPLELRAPRSAAVVPGTIVEPIADFRRQGEIPKTVFEPIPQRPIPVAIPRPAPAAAQPKARPRFLLVGLVAGVLMMLLLLIVVIGGKDKKAPTTASTTVAPSTTTTMRVTTTTAPAVAVAKPADLLQSLQYDRALHAWETQLASGDDPQIRVRYADLALEIGRIHAANQSPGATTYFERAVKFGPPQSAAVAEAKRRLGR